jgi:hypothetical protein
MKSVSFVFTGLLMSQSAAYAELPVSTEVRSDVQQKAAPNLAPPAPEGLAAHQLFTNSL